MARTGPTQSGDGSLPPAVDPDRLETAAHAMLVTEAELDPPGPRILFANRALCDLTGYARDELIGASPRILQGPDTERDELDRLRTRLARGDGFFARTWNYRRDGTPYLAEWSVTPLRDDAGVVTHFMATHWRVGAADEADEGGRASRDLLERAEAVAAVGGWEVDPATYAVRWTRTAQAIFDVPADFELTVGNVLSYYTEPYRERIRHAVEHAIATGEGWDLELELVDGSGRRKWVRVMGEAEMAAGQCVRLTGTVQDITERRLAQEREWAAEQFLLQISEHLPGFLYQLHCDADGAVTDVPFISSGIERVCGLSADEVRRRPETWLERIHPDDRRALAANPPALRGAAGWRVEYRLRVPARDGQGDEDHVWVEDAAMCARGDHGRPVWHGYVLPIGERKALEDQLRAQAYRDPLTGLGNRSLIRERLEREIAAATRKGERVALFYVDLDGFKAINDRWGHPTGDELLRQVAQRLSEQFRAYDEVARVGGDEFVIAAGRVSDKSEPGRLAERLLIAFDAPFTAAGQRFEIGVSIGISIYPDDGADIDLLMSRADDALYRAKQSSGSSYVFDRGPPGAAGQRGVSIKPPLREALARDEVELAYQPIVEAETGAVVAYEALARRRKEDGSVEPASRFIDAAAASGALVELGQQTLVRACRAAAAWPAAVDAEVVVNVLPQQLDQPDFFEHVQSCQQAAGLEPSRLVLELPVASVTRTNRVRRDVLRALRNAGFQIGVDDFGLAGTSLEVAVDWPLDQLKLGAAFVRGIERDPARAAVVESIQRFGERLGVTVVAKQVERAAEANALRAIGCQRLQGYLLGAPRLARR